MRHLLDTVHVGCSCSCYLQSMALFMPLPPALFRALVLSRPSLIAKCQGELSVAAVFSGHSHPCSVFEAALQCAFGQILKPLFCHDTSTRHAAVTS